MGFFKKFKKKEKQEEKDLSKEREDAVKPLAKNIIEAVFMANLNMGKLSADDEKEYSDLALKIIERMLTKEMKYRDKDFLFQLVLQPFDKLRDIVTNSLARSFDDALEASLGKEFSELTLADLDKVLKTKRLSGSEPVNNLAH